MAGFEDGPPGRDAQAQALLPAGALSHGPGAAPDAYPLDRLAEFAAAVDSANYVSERMAGARRHADKFALLRDALDRRPRDGLVLEFGVYEGATLDAIAARVDGPVFGFDCFDGLPEDWRPGFPKGMFRRAIPAVRPNVELVIGLFEATLPGFLAAHPGPVGFLHVDCDLYSSTCTVLRHCAPRIAEGTVIVFDEYFNYPGWRQHEFRAFQEFVAAAGRGYEYLSLVPSHQQVAVVITR